MIRRPKKISKEDSDLNYLECLEEMYNLFKKKGYIYLRNGMHKPYHLNHHFLIVIKKLEIVVCLFDEYRSYYKWNKESPDLLMVAQIKNELSKISLNHQRYKKLSMTGYGITE